MHERILVVEDEARLREILCDYFHAKGAEPIPAENGIQALETLAEQPPFDALLLDVMMPGLDGFSVCRAVRKDSRTPILFLTALSDEEDALYGFELGADDYIPKPFSLALLYAKTMALIARTRGAVGTVGILSAGGVTLDLDQRTAEIDGEKQTLAPKEFDLLRCFLENRNQVLTREQLLQKVWGYDYEGEVRTVDTHVKKLRARGVELETIVRVGYCFHDGGGKEI